MTNDEHDPVIGVKRSTLQRWIREAVDEALEARAGERDSLRLLTAAEVGEILRVAERTVFKWAKNEGLPHRELGPKVIRFVEAEVLAWGARRKAG